MFKKYTVCLLTGLGIFSGSLHADAPGTTSDVNSGMGQNSMSALIPGDPIQDDQRSPGIFNSAMYKPKQDKDLFVIGDFLYWAANRPYNDFIPITKSATTSPNSKQIVHQTPFRPGFKVGFGMRLPGFDQFVMNMIWTRIHQTTATSVSPERDEVLTVSQAIIQTPTVFLSHVKSVQKYNIDFFEVNAGRPIYLSKRIIINTFFGLKGFYTTQKRAFFYDILNISGGGNGFSETKTAYWGIGPNVHCEAKGLLGYGLYLFGKGGMTAAYIKVNKGLSFIQFPQVATPSHTTRSEFGPKKPYLITPLLEGGVGLGWNSYFWNDSYHFDLSGSYDVIATWIASLSFTPPISPIGLHGFTLKAQLDF